MAARFACCSVRCIRATINHPLVSNISARSTVTNQPANNTRSKIPFPSVSFRCSLCLFTSISPTTVGKQTAISSNTFVRSLFVRLFFSKRVKSVTHTNHCVRLPLPIASFQPTLFADCFGSFIHFLLLMTIEKFGKFVVKVSLGPPLWLANVLTQHLLPGWVYYRVVPRLPSHTTPTPAQSIPGLRGL